MELNLRTERRAGFIWMAAIIVWVLWPSNLWASLNATRWTDWGDAEMGNAIAMADASTSLNTDFNVNITFYHLSIAVNPSSQTIAGSTYIELSPTIGNLSQVKLNLHNSMSVTAVSEDAASWSRYSDNTITITLNRTFTENETVKLRINYNGTPVSPNGTKGFRFFPNGNNLPMAITLSTPYLAHYWFPCKDGPTDKADKVYVDITTPTLYGGETMKGISNGVLTETTTSGGNTTFKWQHHHECVPYYVMVAVGRYDTIEDTYNRNGHNVPLEYFVFPNDKASATTGVSIMPQAFDAFIHYFGDYPFKDEKYGMTQMGFYGGIENQTNAIMNSLSSSWRETMVHELAHMWFGCAVTCTDWHHVWINEGFASYAEALYYKYVYDTDGLSNTDGDAAYLSHMNSMRYLDGGTIYLSDDTNPFGIFNTIAYNKGAWVLHMLRWELGDEVFFNCLKTFAQDSRYRYKNASTQDFESLCEGLSGRDLGTFFDQWIYDIYHPVYKYNFYSDVAKGKTGLTLYQYQHDSWGERVFFDVKLQVRFTFQDGTSIVETVRNNQMRQTFYFDFTKVVTSITIDPNSWVLLNTSYNSRDASIVVPVAPVGDKQITGFAIAGQEGASTIDQTTKTVSLTMPYGTDKSSLSPTIAISSGATIIPGSGQAVNFTSPVLYTVTAADGTKQVYTVAVANALNAAKQIESFGISGQIGVTEIDQLAKTVTVTMPVGADLTALAPVVTVSADATISPVSGISRNFTTTQTYTVTAQNGTSQIYMVTVAKLPSPDLSLNDVALCRGETVAYTTSLNSLNQYRWTVTGGAIVTENGTLWRTAAMDGNTIDVEWNQQGSGTVMVEERVGTSLNVGSEQLTVTVFDAIDEKLVTASQSIVYEGESVNIVVPISQLDVAYQLRNISDATNIGSPMNGTGANLYLPSGSLAYESDGYVFGVKASNAGCALTMEEQPTVDIYPDFVWKGNINGNWNNHHNWVRDEVPSPLDDVLIKEGDHNPLISDEVTIKQLRIENGASLVLNPGARMTVNGDVVNTGDDIIIKNTVTEPASFLTYGNLGGPVSVEWVYPTGRYFYIGHCVDGQAFSVYQALSPSPYLFRYTSAWSEITTAAYSFDTNKLEGYSVKFNGVSDATLTLSGNLRVGSYGPLAINGWHLVGNPYPTYIDLESSGLSLGNALTTIWTTTNVSGSAVYATYNISTHVGANGGTRYMAPGQSFWVRNYSASNLSINNTVRTHATGSLKAASTIDDVLRLTLSKGTTADEAVVVFRNIGNESYSAVYDSEKRFTTGTSEMSLYTQKDSRKLIINALPVSVGRRVVPLYINVGSANAGTFKISATNLSEFMPDVDVYLLDKNTGETTNLREKPEYVFTTTAVTAQDRFELSFATKPGVEVPTDIVNGQSDGINITAIGIDNKAIIKVEDASFIGYVTIDIMDALGRLHDHIMSETVRTEVGAPNNTQFYLVKVTYKNKVEIFKIVTKMD